MCHAKAAAICIFSRSFLNEIIYYCRRVVCNNREVSRDRSMQEHAIWSITCSIHGALEPTEELKMIPQTLQSVLARRPWHLPGGGVGDRGESEGKLCRGKQQTTQHCATLQLTFKNCSVAHSTMFQTHTQI
jgi:hypothetical protein